MYVCIEYVYNSEAKTCKSGGSLEVGRVERGGEWLTVPETVDTNQNCLQSLMSSEGTLTDPHTAAQPTEDTQNYPGTGDLL